MEDKDDCPHLPAVAGRRMTCSIAKLERRCRFLLKVEQEKILPDNQLIDALCNCVRMGREYCDHVKGSIK